MSEPGRMVRPAVPADSAVLLAWRNDPSAYAWYGSPGPVTAAEHEAWLADRLGRSRPRLWLLEQDGEPLGSVRVDATDEIGTVSVVVDAAARRRGVAADLLAFADGAAADDGLRVLRAEVHPDNAASLALFRAAGYRDAGADGDFAVLERELDQPR